jgi:hypothetical protein
MTQLEEISKALFYISKLAHSWELVSQHIEQKSSVYQ